MRTYRYRAAWLHVFAWTTASLLVGMVLGVAFLFHQHPDAVPFVLMVKSGRATRPTCECLLIAVFLGALAAIVLHKNGAVTATMEGIDCWTNTFRRFARWSEIKTVAKGRQLFVIPSLILSTVDGRRRMYIPLAIGGDVPKLFAAIRELAPPENVLRKYVEEHYDEDGKEKQPAADS